MKKEFFVFFLLLLFVLPVVQAVVSPYRAQIDSIENGKYCLSIQPHVDQIEIINHCQEEFYFYDGQGNLDESFVMVNSEEYKKNREKYQEFEGETGKDYLGHDYRNESSFEYSECYDGSKAKEKIVDGINVCNQAELEKAGFGTVVKYWAIKLLSKEDGQDTIIEGRTIYTVVGSTPIFPFMFLISVLLFLASIILFSIKKIPPALFLALLILSGIILFVGIALING